MTATRPVPIEAAAATVVSSAWHPRSADSCTVQ